MAQLNLEPPEALVIHCGDPRFQSAFREFKSRELGILEGQYIPLIVPGSVASLCAGTFLPKNLKIMREQIQLLLKHYPVERVILINHEGCRSYGAMLAKLQHVLGKDAVKKQLEDLEFAAGMIRQIAQTFGGHPKVESYMARVRQEDREVYFERIGSV
ncbi:MAG TPA: hypothetical protein VKU19_31495 [Bryobacteraceae bacterium]|nr:hypothetical protein [Bryobacteraceae bacterium]